MRLRTLSCTLSFAGLGILASAVLLAQGQSERPQFRAGVELLQLDVVVLDNKRQPVRGLTAADFTVLDNGVETLIRAFTPIELARPRASEAVWAGDVAPDVVTNQVGEEDGRLVVILMDRTIPLEEPTVTARKIATAAVESLGPHDLAAVVSTNNSAVQTRAVQNLTADRTRLLDAINAADPSTGMSGTAEGIMNMPGSPFKIDPLNDSRCLCGLCVLETITRVAEAVQSTPRRPKVLFFIGSSMIWQSRRPISQSFEDPGCETRLEDARGVMFAAIDRANLTVHSIDPQGLVNAAPQSQASTTNRGPASAVASLQTGLTNTLIDRESLNVLPARTGGRAVVGRNNPELTIPEIFRESDAYYVIGVERAVSARPDATRTIQVKVGRKGLRVVAQRKYVATTSIAGAPAEGVQAPATVEDALNGLLPNAGMPLALGVTAFSNTEKANPVVRVNVDAGAFARSDGAPVPLDLTVAAVDRTGKPVASARQTSTITATRLASGSPIEVNVQSHLELQPGDYGLRVAVSDAASGKVASVFSDITVPNFDNAPLSLSGLSVETATSGGGAAKPTTRRSFKRGDVVRGVLQIYQGTQRTDALTPVVMRVRILDTKGTALRDQSLPFPESSFANRRTDCVITLPLSTLVPGEYLLKLDASANRRTSGRALPFRVE
jgi:VWFA-related protein